MAALKTWKDHYQSLDDQLLYEMLASGEYQPEVEAAMQELLLERGHDRASIARRVEALRPEDLPADPGLLKQFWLQLKTLNTPSTHWEGRQYAILFAVMMGLIAAVWIMRWDWSWRDVLTAIEEGRVPLNECYALGMALTAVLLWFDKRSGWIGMGSWLVYGAVRGIYGLYLSFFTSYYEVDIPFLYMYLPQPDLVVEWTIGLMGAPHISRISLLALYSSPLTLLIHKPVVCDYFSIRRRDQWLSMLLIPLGLVLVYVFGR